MNYFRTSLTSKPCLPQRSPQNWPLFAKNPGLVKTTPPML